MKKEDVDRYAAVPVEWKVGTTPAVAFIRFLMQGEYAVETYTGKLVVRKPTFEKAHNAAITAAKAAGRKAAGK